MANKTSTKWKRRAATSRPSRSSKVARWGNSLGVRIPQDLAEQLQLKAGQSVAIQIERDSITITPARKKWSEADLLRGVKPDMVGGEIDYGGPVGREVW